MKLYRSANGGHILSNINPDSQRNMVFLGTVVKATDMDGSTVKVFNRAQHCPQYVAPTANELRYYGVN
jgi:hypothetical protein